MKVLFDCIVTSEPSRCSTTVQFFTLANLLLEQEDMFIYWPVPDNFTDEEMEFYPVDDRIKYISLMQYKDRMKEYNRFPPELDQAVLFNGPYWDWDVLVTVRSPQVPSMRVQATSLRQKHRAWTKRIIIIEEMMVLSKKPTVHQSNVPVQDRLLVEGYLAADNVLIPAYHEKNWVKQVAKKYFTPSMVKEATDKIMEVCHLDIDDLHVKTEHKYHKGRKLNVAFVGRLEKGNARLVNINEILKNQFIMNSDAVHPFICTVSTSAKLIDQKAIDLRRPNREEFWEICETEMDLAIFMHVDVELNMSMLEPISMGVPSIVKKAPWSIAMLGEDYPLFIDTEKEGYAFISMFTKDYDGMYAKFEEWFENWFRPTYDRRMTDEGLYSNLMELITNPITPPDESMASMEDNEIVGIMVEHGGSEFNMFDLIRKLGKTHLRSLADKVKEGDAASRSIAFSTPWNDFRLALKLYYGYEDASIETGHLRRIKK